MTTKIKNNKQQNFADSNKMQFKRKTMRRQILYTIINFVVLLLVFVGVTATVFYVTDENYVRDIDVKIIATATELMRLPMQAAGSSLLNPSDYVIYYDVYGNHIEGYGNADNIINLQSQREVGDKLDKCYRIELKSSPYRVYVTQSANKQSEKGEVFYVKVLRNVDGMNIAYKKLADGLMIYLPVGAVGLFFISITLAIAQIKPYRNALENSYTFTSDVSHELNTPLAIIKANIESIVNDSYERDEEEYKSLLTCLSETDRLRRLTKQLLLLSRSDNRRLITLPEATNIKEVVENICEPYRFTAEDQIKTFNMNVKFNCNTKVMIDKDMFSQVLISLLDNALKYTDMGESINVDVSIVRDKINLSVTDNGKGVKEEELSKIFLRFYRSEASRTTTGTGLGLPIVHAIISAMQGKVMATNLRPHGFGIYITIPIEYAK